VAVMPDGDDQSLNHWQRLGKSVGEVTVLAQRCPGLVMFLQQLFKLHRVPNANRASTGIGCTHGTGTSGPLAGASDASRFGHESGVPGLREA
jgi:hypothetical protein